jgi:hypothetical protein
LTAKELTGIVTANTLAIAQNTAAIAENSKSIAQLTNNVLSLHDSIKSLEVTALAHGERHQTVAGIPDAPATDLISAVHLRARGKYYYEMYRMRRGLDTNRCTNNP